MNRPDAATPNMALFCDFENVALGVREANYERFDINRVLERLLLKGSIVVKKAYCDWERYREHKAAMHEASFELIEIPHVRMSGKNSADIRMVVDALDLCYTKSHVDCFVIISGDSDFSPLVSKLRENAKTVIGVGVKNSTSDLLIKNCDEFIFYDDLVRGTGRRAVAKARPAGAAARGAAAKAGSAEAAPHSGSTQSGPAQAGPPQHGPAQHGPAQHGPAQPGSAQPGSAQPGSAQAGTTPAQTSTAPSPPAKAAASRAAAATRTGGRAKAASSATALSPPPAPVAAPTAGEPAAIAAAAIAPARATDTDAPVSEERVQRGLDLIVETVDALVAERDEDERIWGSMVKQALKRRNPGFNEQYYGYRSFNRMLEDARDRHLLVLEGDARSGGYIVRLV